MVALEMAQRIFGMLPPALVRIDGTEATMEPLLLVITEEDAEHLAGGAVVVLAGLVAGQAARQGRSRYAVCEYGSQEVDRRVVTPVGDAACLDQSHVWSVVGSRTRLLAEGDPSIRVCSYPAVSRWVVCRGWVGIR